ncbi:MAG: hypothetical protein KatS3mg068_1766 [Candidatus Sericytochromatia bacterium]|nr:MAG: hypothetical protein KatS3mg068_1766 [Candidatus Sericytochromatia bacterium]
MFESNVFFDKTKKFLKYTLLIEAEIVSRLAKKIQEDSELFVKKFSDKDYEQSISDIFDGVEKTMENFVPKIEKVKESVGKIIDLSSFRKNA